MAELIQVAGPCHILLNSGASSALQPLGYTENGAELREEMLALDVPGDQNGGDQGAPIDIQYLTLMGHVHLEMSKWDETVARVVQAKANPNGTSPPTQGVTGAPGTLIISNSWHFRLLLFPSLASTLVRNFLFAIPQEAHGLNLGTKYSRFLTDWRCLPPVGGGTYWNTTSS